MTIKQLLVNHCNFTKYCSSNKYDGTLETIIVKYSLSVPANFKNSEWVKNDNSYITYGRSKNYTSLQVGYRGPECIDINKYDYPITDSNRKKAIFRKEYRIADLIDKDLGSYLFAEREKYFADIKSSILLNQIGVLSKKWENISNGEPMKNFYPHLLEPETRKSYDCKCDKCVPFETEIEFVTDKIIQ